MFRVHPGHTPQVQKMYDGAHQRSAAASQQDRGEQGPGQTKHQQ